MISISDQLITINEAILISGYGRTTVQRWIHTGKIEAKQIGNVWIMDKNDVIRLAGIQSKMGRPRKETRRDIA